MNKGFWVSFAISTIVFIASIVLYHLSPLWIWGLPTIGRITVITIDILWAFQLVVIIDFARGDSFR